MPWQQMVIDSTGAVAPCCYWGAYENNNPPIGNLKTQTVDEIWNGEGYQALRKGMASGDLKAAGCAKCHALRQGNALGFEQDPDSEGDFTTPYAKNLRVLRQEIAEGAAVLEAKPTIVSYTPSHRCNIRCTHCYQESTRTVEVDRAEADEEIRRLAPYLVRLVAGGGEPFLLTTWKKFLSEFDLSENPYLTFSKSTNATIVSDAVVNQLEQFKNLTLNISMDGVGKTYERVRVGAKFDQVAANVRRLQGLVKRAPSGLGYLGVSMCVMKSNIRGLADFIGYANEERLPFGISPVTSMPPSENLRCFNGDPREEMAGWKEAIDEALAELELYFPTLGYLIGSGEIPDELKQRRRLDFEMLRNVIPFELAEIPHRRITFRIPEAPLEQFRQTYGSKLVAYIFKEGSPSALSDYWAPIVHGTCEVWLPEGKFFVNIAGKWAPAGFWDQLPFTVGPSGLGLVRSTGLQAEFAEQVPVG